MKLEIPGKKRSNVSDPQYYVIKAGHHGLCSIYHYSLIYRHSWN